MEQSPYEKLVGARLVKEFPTFCGTWRFVTTFTSSCLRPHEMFYNTGNLYSEELLVPCSNPNLEDHPLSALCGSLFSICAVIYLQLPFIFLHSQPEDVPRCCDGDPLITVPWLCSKLRMFIIWSPFEDHVCCGWNKSNIHRSVYFPAKSLRQGCALLTKILCHKPYFYIKGVYSWKAVTGAQMTCT
jgi:hypothetical protein